MQTKFGMLVLKSYECPPIAVLGELVWPAMSEVAVVQKYAFLMRVENLDVSRLVKRGLQST